MALRSPIPYTRVCNAEAVSMWWNYLDIELNVQTNAKNQSQGIDGIRFTSALSSFVTVVSNQSIDPTSNQYYMDPVYKQRIIEIIARFF